jgi:hypothetical protein
MENACDKSRDDFQRITKSGRVFVHGVNECFVAALRWHLPDAATSPLYPWYRPETGLPSLFTPDCCIPYWQAGAPGVICVAL